MTNNPTIDGVSRATIEKGFDVIEGFVVPTIKISLPPCHVDDDESWNARDAASEAIRTFLDAPVVERQPAAEWCDPLQLKAIIKAVVARERMRPASLPDSEVAKAVYEAITEHLPVYEDVYDQLSEIIEPHVKRPYRLDAPLPASVVDSMGFLLKAYTNASPEVAALQSTIAQFEGKLNKAIDLDFKRRETIEQLQARIAELERGRGEAVTMDGKTTIRQYCAETVPDDECANEWTKGYEECKRRIHAMFKHPINNKNK